MFLSYISWNPSREAFVIPYLDLPIYWYSLWFALGFMGGLFFLRHLLRLSTNATKDELDHFLEKFILYTVPVILLGSRLGHVLFYDHDIYFAHPSEIIKVWHGGLASHGGIIGFFLGFLLFEKQQAKKHLFPSGFCFLDLIALSSLITAGCIRIGNFFNQEIIGTPTSFPWAVLFQNPQESSLIVPRHPTQLYEATFAFLLFGFLFCLRKKLRPGSLSGLLLIILFSFRIVIELVKAPQCELDSGFFHMGQLLSIPMIILGIIFIVIAKTRKPHDV